MPLTYTCTCPDSRKNRDYMMKDTGWEALTNDWGTSKAGAIGGKCKHILATMLIRGELKKGDIPTDLPFDIEKPKAAKEYFQTGYGGDAFDRNDSFGVAGF